MYMDINTLGWFIVILVIISGLISFLLVKKINRYIYNMPQWLDITVFWILSGIFLVMFIWAATMG